MFRTMIATWGDVLVDMNAYCVQNNDSNLGGCFVLHKR